MRKLLANILAIIALCFLFTACDDPSLNSVNGTPANVPQAEQKPVFGGLPVSFDPAHKIDELSKVYYVVLDGSQSMTETACNDPSGRSKSDVSKEAVKQFANMVPKDAYLGLLVFDSRGITERVPLAVGDRDAFLGAVDDAHADSNTPLATAIAKGYHAIDVQASYQRGYGEYHLVIVTDGEASMGEDPDGVVGEILTGSPVVIHTIGFCIGDQHSLNQPGKTYYTDANSPDKLKDGLKSVLAEQSVGTTDLMK